MVIAIDYDGTIGDTNREKVRWIAANLGKTVSPWECDMTHCVPIIGREAYRQLGDTVYEREGTLRAAAVPGALAALGRLSRQARLYVLTARPERRLAYAREWLEQHGVLSCFAGLVTSHGSAKAAVCSAIGADVLVDDDVRHLLQVDTAHLCRILLQDGRQDAPDYGPEVRFCRSWPDVVQCIENSHRNESLEERP